MIRIRLPLPQAQPLFDTICSGINSRQGETMSNNLILFGSTLGDTERIARRLAELLPGETRVASVANFRMASLRDFDRIILGTSTWGSGELQDDWEGALGQLSGLDLSGKTVALFGLGDASAYPETFVDGLGILHEAVAQAGAVRIGYWPTEGYAFEASRAVIGGRFAGLVLDEAGQSHLTGERLTRWAQDLQASA